jgi:hypothetical protein
MSRIMTQTLIFCHTPHILLLRAPGELGLGNACLRLWPCSAAVLVDPSKVNVKHLPQKRLLRKTIPSEFELRIGARGTSAFQEIIIGLRLDY